MTSNSSNNSNNARSPLPRRLLEGAPLPTFIAKLPEDAASATWQCPTCGPITPRPVQWAGITRYTRGRCSCQQAEEQRRRAEQERAAWEEAQVASTFGWLERTPFQGSPLTRKTFDTFERSRQPEAFDTAYDWAQCPHGTLILYGEYGTGKTHLLAAIANAARRSARVSSLFATVTDLFVAIQERIAAHEDHLVLLQRAARTSLLLLDDIDKARHTDFREETYFAIIDKRTQHGLPTAITTNKIDELASFMGGAVASRLKIGQIALPMYGEDIRSTL